MGILSVVIIIIGEFPCVFYRVIIGVFPQIFIIIYLTLIQFPWEFCSEISMRILLGEQ